MVSFSLFFFHVTFFTLFSFHTSLKVLQVLILFLTFLCLFFYFDICEFVRDESFTIRGVGYIYFDSPKIFMTPPRGGWERVVDLGAGLRPPESTQFC